MPQKPSACRECRHILTTGRKCHSPALTGKPFCHHHSRQRNIAGCNQRSTNSVELPPLEDHASIRIAIDQVVFALTHGRIEDKLAGRLLYAIQLAQNSINRTEEIDPAEMVTDYVDGRFGDIAAPAEPGNETGSESSTADDFALLAAHAKTHPGHGDTCWEPTNADYPISTVIQSEFTPGERVEGPVVASQASNLADKPSAEANPAPPKPGPQKSGPWDNPLLDHIVHQLQSGMSEREVAAQLARDLRSGNAPA
jgi:hypothetical protein